MINDGQWDFPDFGGGQTHGIDGDSAVSTFKGTALPSLAKEVLQNSLDARMDKEQPAVVKFSVFCIPTEALPGKKDLYEKQGNCTLIMIMVLPKSCWMQAGVASHKKESGSFA